MSLLTRMSRRRKTTQLNRLPEGRDDSRDSPFLISLHAASLRFLEYIYPTQFYRCVEILWPAVCE
jgi:hypothetical protein